MGLFYDSTYLLVILAALISMAVSARMNTIFSKYQTVRSYSGMTGREAAMRILHQAGIYDVTVRHVSGKLTDHYDPRTKTVNLSDAVYDSTSVAAIGVAAHECGHAVQHNCRGGLGGEAAGRIERNDAATHRAHDAHHVRNRLPSRRVQR